MNSFLILIKSSGLGKFLILLFDILTSKKLAEFISKKLLIFSLIFFITYAVKFFKTKTF